LLLRAHPLLDNSIIDSPFFGRRFAFATTEYQKPVKRTRTGVVAIAGFVDMGQAWRTLLGPGASAFQVDAGVGIRLRVSPRNGARIDIAHGVPNGGLTISAGYTYGAGVVLSRGTPW
jgi:outer membrane protein assembly factor BamA